MVACLGSLAPPQRLAIAPFLNRGLLQPTVDCYGKAWTGNVPLSGAKDVIQMAAFMLFAKGQIPRLLSPTQMKWWKPCTQPMRATQPSVSKVLQKLIGPGEWIMATRSFEQESQRLL